MQEARDAAAEGLAEQTSAAESKLGETNAKWAASVQKIEAELRAKLEKSESDVLALRKELEDMNRKTALWQQQVTEDGAA